MVKQVRRSRRRRRPDRAPGSFFGVRLLICAVCMLIGFTLGFACLTYAPRAYNTWRESRLQKRAAEMMQKGDLEEAGRIAQRILQIRPNSVAAFHILADTTEKQNRSETVAWRSQIARQLPHKLDAHLNLASAALRFGQLDIARRALDSVAPADRGKAAYHVVAGWLSRAQGNEKDVEQHFAAALEQEPANDLYQYNLAALRIRSLDPKHYDDARAILERLRKVPGFRAGSLRALLSDAVARDDLERADGLAQDLQMTQQVTFADYLLCLDFYRKLDEKKFFAILEKIKPVAARSGGDLAALMDWMNSNGFAGDVLKWSEKLPPELTTAPPPAVSVSEAFVEVKNWSRLKRWTRSGAWGDSEFLRLAYQAFSARQTKQSGADAEFDSLWRSAERSASEQPERELQLARLAMRWNLPAEAERLWQRVAKHVPLRREALDSLARLYRGTNDLRRLHQIAKQLHESSPREVGLMANYARLGLLLDPSTDEAQRKAKEAYEAAPTDANSAVTHAFALYGLGRTGQGLEVLRKLPPGQLLNPHFAAYAAVLLLDDNQGEAAKEYVVAAKEGPLYPEEKELLDEALAKAAGVQATPSPAPAETPVVAPAPTTTPTPAVPAETSPTPPPPGPPPAIPAPAEPTSTPTP